MIYRDFGTTGWRISAVGLGTWNIGNQWGAVDDATAWSTIRSGFDHGINLFDTAESYGIPNGLSEERLGIGLAGIRHQVYIVTKIGNWGKRTGQGVPLTTVDMIRLCMHASLHRLRTDWVDTVLCHDGTIEDPTIFLEAFDELKSEGRLRTFGISTDSLSVLKKFNVHNTCSVVQVNYSLLNRAPEAQLLPYCEEHAIAVMIRGPLGMGLLSGRYSKETVFSDDIRAAWHGSESGQRQLEEKLIVVDKLKNHLDRGESLVTAALRYVISHQTNPVAIPGAKSSDQVIMNARAGDRVFSDDEYNNVLRLLN
jgi:aryl-alcohol dehydrogenase-like predicted oxidoreductase